MFLLHLHLQVLFYFLQDIVKDKKIGRVYIPSEIMKNHNVSKDMFEEEYKHNYASKKNITNLLNEMVDINRNLYNSGNILPKLLTKKDRTIIQIFIDSGEKILSKIEKRKYNSLFNKPSTNKFEKFQVLMKYRPRNEMTLHIGKVFSCEDILCRLLFYNIPELIY